VLCNKVMSDLVGVTLKYPMFDSMLAEADIYAQLTVPSFEYPRKNLPSVVQFVGSLPVLPGQAAVPDWAADLDGSRKVVFVTQGTVSNADLNILIVPALEALAEAEDLIVVVGGGGRSVDDLPITLPSNARFASYLPFEWLMPKIDIFITNGGYGTVNQALGYGVPIIGAGITEDKAEVNARIAWTGAGIDLKANSPTPGAIREAVHAMLTDPRYRERAGALADENRALPTLSLIKSILTDEQGTFAQVA
jgi:UDP:flavonoid glycosyltransferase YjiC (YdhE family)